MQPLLELKTRPRVRPVSESLSMFTVILVIVNLVNSSTGYLLSGFLSYVNLFCVFQINFICLENVSVLESHSFSSILANVILPSVTLLKHIVCNVTLVSVMSFCLHAFMRSVLR
jgi:hypothetical protein